MENTLKTIFKRQMVEFPMVAAAELQTNMVEFRLRFVIQRTLHGGNDPFFWKKMRSIIGHFKIIIMTSVHF